MNPITFKLVSGTDREYYHALVAIQNEGIVPFDKATFGPIGEKPFSELAKDAVFQEVLAQDVRVFSHISFKSDGKYTININRPQEGNSVYDTVNVSPHAQPYDAIQFARLVAAAQKHLGQPSLMDVGNLLGPAASQHFEAREIALDRLEKLATKLLIEMEDARKRSNQEYVEKEATLEKAYQSRHEKLEADVKTKLTEVDEERVALDNRAKELDDRAAKHARRQHYKDLKDKFASWSKTFGVTTGTQSLRRNVSWFTGFLLVVFGGIAGWFLFQSFTAGDTPHFVAASVKQVVFSALFVSTAYFFIRWNQQWFQRHADEEFRLKRMEIDIDRASWFVEMAFEWMDDKGGAIPAEVTDRLTRGLFVNDSGCESAEPVDSLAQALLGASRIKLKLPGGSEVEYDKKAIQEIQEDKRA